MNYNQILSYFDIQYPKRLCAKDNKTLKLRQRFRKTASKYVLDEIERLCIKNPLNKTEEIEEIYKIIKIWKKKEKEQ